ncbi:MAG: hypothetical protein ACR2OH_10410, partial [Microthrixaceae bacterium]
SAGGAELRFWAREDSVFVAVGPGDIDEWLCIAGLGIDPGGRVLDGNGGELEFRLDAGSLAVANRFSGEWPVIKVERARATPL